MLKNKVHAQKRLPSSDKKGFTEFKMRQANRFREEMHSRSKKFCRTEINRRSAGFTIQND